MDKKKLAIDAAVGAVAGMIGYQTGKFVKKKKFSRKGTSIPKIIYLITIILKGLIKITSLIKIYVSLKSVLLFFLESPDRGNHL